MTKTTNALTILALLAGCCLLPQPTCAVDASDSQSGLLLRWQTDVDYEGFFVFEVLVYRDGLVVEKGGPAGGNVGYSRGVADPLELAELKRALSANRVGILRADGCKAVSILPTGGEYKATLTWFGKAGRQNRLEVNADCSCGICASEVNNVILALNAFLNHVTYIDSVQTVP